MIEALFGFIARLIAVILALVFVLATVLTLQARSSDRVLLDPLTWQLALAETNTYLKLPDLVTAEVLHYRAQQPAPAPDDLAGTLLHTIEPQDVRTLTTLLLPSAEVQRVTEDALDQAAAFLTLRRDTLVLDLSGLKRNVAGRNGAVAIEVLAGALPECGQPGCPSPTQVAAMFDPKELAGRLPDQLPLIDGPDDPDWRKDLAFARTLLGFAPLVLVVLLAVVCLFGARSRAGWLRWGGAPLLIAGLITIGLGLAAGPANELLWHELVAMGDDLPSPTTMVQVRAVFDAVAAEHVRHMQFEGGALALLGFALVLVSFFVPERRSHGT